MDSLEWLGIVKMGRIEVGLMLSLRLLAFGLALDTRHDDEYYFSLTIGLGPVSFNICWPKDRELMVPDSNAHTA